MNYDHESTSPRLGTMLGEAFKIVNVAMILTDIPRYLNLLASVPIPC